MNKKLIVISSIWMFWAACVASGWLFFFLRSNRSWFQGIYITELTGNDINLGFWGYSLLTLGFSFVAVGIPAGIAAAVASYLISSKEVSATVPPPIPSSR